VRSLVSTLAVACCFVATVAVAQPDLSVPPELDAGGFDWVKLTSGEWLAGELKSQRDLDMEFDSDKLDLLNIDMGDVAGIYSPVVRTYRFEDMGVFRGTAAMVDDKVTVRTTGGEIRSFPRESLLLIIEGQGSERDYWSASASMGLVTRTGNTEQRDFNARIFVRRQTPRLRSDLNYLSNIGEVGVEGEAGVENEQVINNHNLTVNVDRLVTKGFFVTLGAVNWVRDKFVNIDSRTTLAVGVGYDVYRLSTFEWGLALNGGYQATRYVSVQDDQNDADDTFSIIPSTRIEWDITSDIEFKVNYDAQVSVPETENAFHHADANFAVDVWGDLLDITLSLVFDRVENPKENANGITPERNDFRTSFGLGVSI
jgi:putative salt-induced outer membrane protein YdiY